MTPHELTEEKLNWKKQIRHKYLIITFSSIWKEILVSVLTSSQLLFLSWFSLDCSMGISLQNGINSRFFNYMYVIFIRTILRSPSPSLSFDYIRIHFSSSCTIILLQEISLRNLMHFLKEYSGTSFVSGHVWQYRLAKVIPYTLNYMENYNLWRFKKWAYKKTDLTKQVLLYFLVNVCTRIHPYSINRLDCSYWAVLEDLNAVKQPTCEIHLLSLVSSFIYRQYNCYR